MPIVEINEIINKTIPKQEPIKEKMNITIPGIQVNNIPSRNGFVYLLCGSGGSGKTNILLNFLKESNHVNDCCYCYYDYCPICGLY